MKPPVEFAQADACTARPPRSRALEARLAWLLLAIASPCLASSDVESCRPIVDDVERLACYDALFGRGDKSNPARDADAAAAGKEFAGSAAETVEGFGAEQLPANSPDEIEARLVGNFTGWSGDTVFRLDNGQVWQQTRNYIRSYTPREPMHEPRVTISKGLFGSYDLRVEGVKRVVQVKRIR